MNSDTITLPPLCVRLLNDKIIDKKKTACRQLEIMTKEWNSVGQESNIRKLLVLLNQDFINSQSSSSKIGGLIAISSVAIALDRDAKFYVDDIVKPIFSCAFDYQRDVRYRTLEAMYNVIKCIRGDILVYLNEIFDIVMRLCEDSDLNVREATNLIDKLIKDIVIECPTFNIVTFIEIVRERIYALTHNTRKIILGWINFLNSVPEIDMLIFIQDILDGLLKIACDQNKEIRRHSETILCEFYNNILENHERVAFKPLIKILLIHVQTDSFLVQNITLQWLAKFITLANRIDILNNSAHILAAILPCLSYARVESAHEEYDDQNKVLRTQNNELAKNLNETLMNLVTRYANEEAVKEDNSAVQSETSSTFGEDHFNISKILIVLANELELGPKTSTQTKIAILEWMLQIYSHLAIDIDETLEAKLLKVLLHSLKDTSDSVVQMDLKVLGKIMFKSSIDPDLSKPIDDSKKRKSLIKSLVDLFFMNPTILNERGPYIICQLCNIMDSNKVYIAFSEILLDYEIRFIHSMVYILHTILLTSKELNSQRLMLVKMTQNGEARQLFICLYKTWCYSPVSVISLCLLTKCYTLAWSLILHFGNMSMNIEVLIEIDQLIQLLESPVFTSLRLDLLDTEKNYHLKKSLYGLLMLLPQSDTFHVLRRRLQCVPNATLEGKIDRSTSLNSDKSNIYLKSIDFDEMLQLYIGVQKAFDQLPNSSDCEQSPWNGSMSTTTTNTGMTSQPPGNALANS